MKDWTSGIALFGTLFTNSPVLETGATYRVSYDYWGMSCQYWDPKAGLRYMAPTENPYVTGVGSALWQDSVTCGQCLEIRYKKVNVTVVIADYCPPPCSAHQLDLAPETSAKLASSKHPRNFGAKELKVRRVKCNWGRKPELYLHKHYSEYVWYIIPLFFVEPPKTLWVLGVKATHDKYGRFVVSFKNKKPQNCKTYKVRVDNQDLFLKSTCYNFIMQHDSL